MPPSFISFDYSFSIPSLKTWLLMWKCSPGGRKNENRAGEKKVQVLTLKGRLDSREGDLFHFYTSLKHKVTMLGKNWHDGQNLTWWSDIVSFFNELEDQLKECSGIGFIFTQARNQWVNYAWKNSINMIYRGWKLSPSMIASEAYP